MSENEGVFWESAKGLRADTALSPVEIFTVSAFLILFPD